MLESAAAEAEVETDRETGGLDKVVECDDEGGGEQVEGVENGNDPKTFLRPVAEVINLICKMKL